MQTFKKLHTFFINVLMLIHFNPELCLRVETDASGYTLTDILSQFVSEGIWHSVAFWLKKMISAEQWYEIYNQKLLAIVMMFKQWRHYLEDSTHLVEVLTDYNNLWDFINIRSLNKRQTRWAMKLAVYDFVILHHSKKSNSADALLRQPNYQEKEQMINHFLFFLQ